MLFTMLKVHDYFSFIKVERIDAVSFCKAWKNNMSNQAFFYAGCQVDVTPLSLLFSSFSTISAFSLSIYYKTKSLQQNGSCIT